MKINIFLIFLLNLFLLVCSLDSNKTIDQNEHLAKMVKNHALNINEEFDDDKVIVTLKSKYSIKNEIFDITRFESEHIAISNSKDDGKIIIESMNDLFMIYDTFYSENVSQFNRILKLNLAKHSKENVVKACNELNKKDFVLFAEPCYKITCCNNSVNVVDEYYESQWGLSNTNGIDIENAWNVIGYGNTEVGVLEKNVIINHEDLNASIDSHHYDISPDDSHGTHVSGIIGAVKNNNGIIGVSQSKIIAYDYLYFISSLGYAANNGIRVINASYEFQIESNQIASYTVAVKNYENAGGLIVAACGNDGLNVDLNPVYPASFANHNQYENINNVIAVGSIDYNGSRSNFSNFGPNTVSIYAPGENILSTFDNLFCNGYSYQFYDGTHMCEFSMETIEFLDEIMINNNISLEFLDENFAEIMQQIFNQSYTPSDFKISTHYSNGYHYMSGTSMAAPFVTGVAALLLSIDSSLTVAQIRDSIINGADDISINVPGSTTSQNVKKLNAFGAIKYALEHYLTITTYNISNGFTTTDYKNITSGNSFFTNKNGFYKLIIPNSCTCNFTVSSNSEVDIQLFNQNFVEQNITDLNNSPNIEEVSITLSAGTYYLKTFYTNNNSSGTITTSISRPHVHDYSDDYVHVNYTQHRAYCSCGSYVLEPHVVSQNAYNSGQRFATCLKCGGLASMGFIGGKGKNNDITYITKNGSFILPNGVIVLADEDIDAYLNGTLFNEKKIIIEYYKNISEYYFEDKKRIDI